MSLAVEALSKFSVFHEINNSTLEKLADSIVVLKPKRNFILYEQGDPPTGFYIMESGYAVLYRQSREKSQILSVLTANDCFGGETISNSMPSPYTAKVVSSSCIYHIPPDQLHQLLENNTDFATVFLGLISTRLRQLTGIVHSLAFRNVSSRLAGVLLTLAEAQSTITDEGIQVPRVLSQQDIASMTGTAREVIYRTLKQFEHQGIIRQTRTSYIILDHVTLSQLASEEVR